MEPTQIIDAPIPLLNGSFSSTFGTSTDPVVADSGASVPTTHVDKAFPQANIAVETISQSLNTETKTILGEYTFESLGAFKVGKFSQGSSGEIDFSPDGLVAKNSNGDTTFSLDGKTGDATFAGIVKAADVQIIDQTGIVSLANFVTDEVSNGADFSTTSSTYVDITGLTINTADLPRAVNVLIFADSTMYGAPTGAGDWGGEMKVAIVVNNVAEAEITMRASQIAGDSNSDVQTLSSHQFMQIPAGVNTFKLQFKVTNLTGNITAHCLNNRLTYVILGR